MKFYSVKSEHVERVTKILSKYNNVNSGGRLLQIEYSSLADYLHLLRGEFLDAFSKLTSKCHRCLNYSLLCNKVAYALSRAFRD